MTPEKNIEHFHNKVYTSKNIQIEDCGVWNRNNAKVSAMFNQHLNASWIFFLLLVYPSSTNQDNEYVQEFEVKYNFVKSESSNY